MLAILLVLQQRTTDAGSSILATKTRPLAASPPPDGFSLDDDFIAGFSDRIWELVHLS